MLRFYSIELHKTFLVPFNEIRFIEVVEPDESEHTAAVQGVLRFDYKGVLWTHEDGVLNGLVGFIRES